MPSDRQPERIVQLDEDRDESDIEINLFPDDGDGDDLLRTPLPEADLTLNPKIGTTPKTPLCPECEQPITETGDGNVVEYQCGCDDLHRFTFTEDTDGN